MLALGAVPLLIWVYLLCARGRFWRVSNLFVTTNEQPTGNSRIAVVIPARDESAVIGEALESLFRQDLAAPLHVFLVDDGSSDGTAAVARETAIACGRTDSLTIVHGQALPKGWTGKLWAASQGVAEAEQPGADYLLLTDADIVHGIDSVRRLLAQAQSGRYDLASYMVKLACVSLAEKALIPAFVFFFFELYPPAWIRRDRSKTAGAAGGCMLIRTDMLRRVGGLAAIRGEVIDDCALARAVKQHGGKVWLGLTTDTRSNRSYGTFREIGRMISRSAFNQLRHSALLLLGAMLGLTLTYVLPVALVLSGRPKLMLPGALAWSLMTVAYLPMVRFYKLPPFWAACLPAVAVFYMGATIHSAWQYGSGKGGEWKGRVQDAKA